MDPTINLHITTRPLARYTAVAVHGELDIATAPVLRRRLLAVLHHDGPQIIVDLSGVGFCDAAGLAALVAAERRAWLLGGTLRLAAPQDRVAKVLRVTRLNRHFGIYPTAADAAHPVDLAGSGASRDAADPPARSPVPEHTSRVRHMHAAEARDAAGAAASNTT